MVNVIVSHENKTYGVEINIQLRKPFLYCSGSYSDINEKSNGPVAEIVAVAVAST